MQAKALWIALVATWISVVSLGARPGPHDEEFKAITADRIVVRGASGEVTIEADPVVGVWATNKDGIFSSLYASPSEGAVMGLRGRVGASEGKESAFGAALVSPPDGGFLLQGSQGKAVIALPVGRSVPKAVNCGLDCPCGCSNGGVCTCGDHPARKPPQDRIP